MRCTVLGLSAILIGSSLATQAPVITSAGDPSIQDDTIYKLRVDPMYYADEAKVLLLDDGVVRFELDGSGSRTYRQVSQVLNAEGVKALSELTFGYTKGSETLRVNWVRVLDSTGKVISAKPSHEVDSAASVAVSSPRYAGQMIHKASLSGVAPGRIVDWSYTVETKVPAIPGDYFTAWRVEPGSATQRSRLVVDLPASADPKIIERHLAFARTESTANGRHVYVWATQNVKKPLPREMFAPDSSYGVTILVGTRRSWDDVAKWYAKTAEGRYVVDSAIRKQTATVLAGARSRDDTLSKLYRWIAQDIRSTPVTFGVGGYTPTSPGLVLANKYGDSKDKSALFIAIVRQLGFDAFPVLVAFNSAIDTSLASAHQFNHMIAAVAAPGGGWQFMDFTNEMTPYGRLREPEQGRFALVVRDDGTGSIVRLPSTPTSEDRQSTSIIGEVTTDGTFRGRLTVTEGGSGQNTLRFQVVKLNALSPGATERYASQLARSVIPGSTGDSLQLFDPHDLNAVARYSVVIEGGVVLAHASGNTGIILPIKGLGWSTVIQKLEDHGARTMPIDALKLTRFGVTENEFRLTLPIGWRVHLPPDVNAVSVFGTYESHYAQDGRELVITRRLTGAEGVQPASSYQTLLTWLQEQQKDDVKVMIVDTGKSSAIPMPLLHVAER